MHNVKCIQITVESWTKQEHSFIVILNIHNILNNPKYYNKKVFSSDVSKIKNDLWTSREILFQKYL